MKLQITLMAVSLALLTGCDGKPPGCGDSQIVDFLNTRVSNVVLAEVAKDTAALPAPEKADTERLTREYLKQVSIGLSSVVTDGYDANAKRHVCAARMTLKTPGATGVYPLNYAIQKTEDSGSNFTVATDGDQTVFGIVFSTLRQYLASGGQTSQSKGEPSSASSASAPIVYQTTQTQEAAKATAGGNSNASPLPTAAVKYTKEDGSIVVKRVATGVEFDLNTSLGAYSCGMNGMAVLVNDTEAKFTSKEAQGCSARLKFKGDTVEVVSEQCDSHYCGMQAAGTMDGVFKRRMP